MAQLYKVDESFDHSLFENSSCAFGVFDGVHRGHRYLLSCAQDTAKETGGQSIALTFDIDPDEIFHPDRLRKLLSNKRRLQMLCDRKRLMVMRPLICMLGLISTSALVLQVRLLI